MKHTFAILILALAAVFLPAASARAQQPEVIAQLQRDQIYEGESVDYQVILNHIENPAAPDLSAFTDFEVVPAGQQSLNSSSVRIINGRITRTQRRGRAYNYRLTPRKSGLLTVPAPKAKIDGRVIEGRALALNVIEPAAQDVVRMEITAEPQDVYPMQPFTVTLSIFIKPLPGRQADEDPLGVLSKAPHLSIPWVDDEQLPAGLEPQVGWKKWIGGYRGGGRTGFVVNNLSLVGRSSIMSMFEDRTELLFAPRGTRVLLDDDAGRPLEYWKYSFRRDFIPKSPGTYTFGPASLKGHFADGALGDGTLDDGRLRARNIYTMARPLTFTVRDVPQQGRPDSYNGLVGNFSVNATLAPQKVKVGDPMTLTLAITGRGTLENAVAPKIAALPGVEGRFKVYDATEKTDDGSICFTYGIRPLTVGNEPFPPIAVSYFDVHAGRYETIATKPLPIEIDKAQRLSTRRIVSAHGSRRGGSQIEARREGIFANETDPYAVHDDGVRPLHWLVGLAVLAAIYIVLALSTRRVKRLRGDTALLRRRGAVAAARGRLRQGLALLAGNEIREGVECIKAALAGLVADTADLAQAGLTPKDVAAQLEKINVSADLVSRLQNLLETCDAAHYAATGLDAAALANEAKDAFDSLAKELKSKGLFR